MTTAAINDPPRCPHCGQFHSTTCPNVKAIEYHPDGSIKRVEFKTATDYDPMLLTYPQIGPNTSS